MIKTWLSVARGSDLPTNLGAVFRRSARNRVPWRGFVRARACALRVYWGRMRLKKTRENNRHSCNGHRGFLAGGGGEWLPDRPIRVSEKKFWAGGPTSAHVDGVLKLLGAYPGKPA
jgi:hypothetical protein